MSFRQHRQQIRFATSANSLNQLAADQGYEVAFCGRSNAGKSSALNVIVGQKQLARVSKTPGRTQLINTFAIDSERRLIDLPGYGYAKVPPKMRAHWDQLLNQYFDQRQSLAGLILLMDVRHPMTELDQQFIQIALFYQLRTHILLTKADKLKRGKATAQLQKLKRDLPEGGLITAQLFSSLNRQGVEEVYDIMDELLAFPATKDSVTQDT